MTHNYHLGLLCLTHLLVCADGIMDQVEIDALKIIKEKERISDSVFKQFQDLVRDKKEREVFQIGIDLINQCSNDEKLNVFVTLYKLSEVDGRVHVKEIRLLLYSIRLTGIEFNDVVNKAIKTPSLL